MVSTRSEKDREYDRRWYQEHKEQRQVSDRQKYQEHPEPIAVGFGRSHSKRLPIPQIGSPARGSHACACLSFLPQPEGMRVSRKDFYDHRPTNPPDIAS